MGNYKELTRPRPENVDLEWIDYKQAEMNKQSVVKWNDAPSIVRMFFALGVVVQIGVCHALFWCYSYLFGDFQVNDDFETDLNWYGTGNNDLFTNLAIVVLVVYLLSWLCYLIFSVWCYIATYARKAAA